MGRARRAGTSLDGKAIMGRIDELARFTEVPGEITRTYLTAAQKAAGRQIIAWMEAAGLAAGFDAVGNVIGRHPGRNPTAPALMIGSHYDTVVNAGRFDGPYGIVAALAAVDALVRAGQCLAFPIHVVAFAEEEGVRYRSALIGSRAIAGTLDEAVLDLVDAGGVRLADALAAFHGQPRPPPIATAAYPKKSLRGFIELHIEQGPVLAGARLPVGVVTGIAGASRFAVTVEGQAGHAGTVPMAMRRDAAAGAAELVLAVERIANAAPGVVGTVGMLGVPGGATNVIPGHVELALDVRAGEDAPRRAAVGAIKAAAREIAARRRLRIRFRATHEAAAVSCDRHLQHALAQAVAARGLPVHHLASGAGHDAMAMAAICPVAMLFVRCGHGGISHNPREIMTAADAAMGAEVLHRVLLALDRAAQ